MQHGRCFSRPPFKATTCYRFHIRTLTLSLYLITVDRRGSTNNAYVNAIETAFPGKLFEAKIRRDITVSRAVLQAKSVFEAYPASRAAYDFERLGDEFIRRMSHVTV